MKEKVYCPTCKQEIELIAACGAAQYFCNHCKRLVSSKAVIKETDLKQEQDLEKK
ncbi:MAG: hypothetical protein E7231_15600 [Cellulosilyticum sp.]|nr:hypothetical protein [Cellulosilyticum sp.]